MRITEKQLATILAKRPGLLTKSDLALLPSTRIELLTLHQVAGLSHELIASLKAPQVAALTQEQVSVLSLEQMGLVPFAARPRLYRLAVKARAKGKPVTRLERLQWTIAGILASVLPCTWALHKLKLI